MPDVVIENPIINSPFKEPQHHFKFTEDGITDQIIPARRKSAYFVPIPQARKKSKQERLPFETEWTADRYQENEFINYVRGKVAIWRQGGYQGVTRTTHHLLDYWQNPERDHRLYFCQIEALETIIYITEVAKRYGDTYIHNELSRSNEVANPELFRIALKMATGSGKTVVMAMIITWHILLISWPTPKTPALQTPS